MTNAAIDRETAIPKRIDPRGKMWTVYHVGNTALYAIGLKNEDGDVIEPHTFPKVNSQGGRLNGMFTKPDIAAKALVTYLNEAWDLSDEATKKAERRKVTLKRAAEAKAEEDKKALEESAEVLAAEIEQTEEDLKAEEGRNLTQTQGESNADGKVVKKGKGSKQTSKRTTTAPEGNDSTIEATNYTVSIAEENEAGTSK